MFENLPDRVSLYEVSPRDGLQNEAVILPTAQKVELIAGLVDAGLRRIEITSFVAPQWIKPLADADDLVRELGRTGAPVRGGTRGVTYSALVPNLRGLERAVSGGLEEIAVFLSASETHNRKNINKSIVEALDAFGEIVPAALEKGMRVRAYVSTAWGCPFEGEVSPKRVAELSVSLAKLGCYQISLGDTIGCGTPLQTQDLLERVQGEVPLSQIALHMHDTRGTALANVLVGLEMGVRDFDVSTGGLGGCPYAPGAAGNLATEDLCFMLEGMGIATGVDLEKLVLVARRATEWVKHPVAGKVARAGAAWRLGLEPRTLAFQ